MQLIKPSLISGEIMNLFEEAEEKVVIVSPYCRISKWYKLLNKFSALQKRNIDIDFYVRDGEIETIKEVESVGFQPILIPNLHCKLYLNEKYGIVSSMNLLLSSENNSLEIAYKTENQTEYNELNEFFKRHIEHHVSIDKKLFEGDWRDYIFNALCDHLKRKVYIQENRNDLEINVGNRYNAFIDNDKHRTLRIAGILSGREFNFAQKNWKVLEENAKQQIELIPGGNGYYNTVVANPSYPLKSFSINEINKSEAEKVAVSIINFILAVEDLKINTR